MAIGPTHQLVHVDRETGRKGMVFHARHDAVANWTVGGHGKVIVANKGLIQDFLAKRLEEALPNIGITHTWEPKDLVCFDNSQVIHKAAPSTQVLSETGGDRLVARVLIYDN